MMCVDATYILKIICFYIHQKPRTRPFSLGNCPIATFRIFFIKIKSLVNFLINHKPIISQNQYLFLVHFVENFKYSLVDLVNQTLIISSMGWLIDTWAHEKETP